MNDKKSLKPDKSKRNAFNEAGYLWRPGSSPQDNPLHLTVAIVIGLVVFGAIALAILT